MKLVWQKQPKNKKRKGVTLIEVLTVISIIGILASISVEGFSSFKKGNDFLLSLELVSNTLRGARMKALNGNEDDNWGVSLTKDQIIIFKGNDFLNRNASFDEIILLSGVTAVSGTTQIIFTKTTGIPSVSGVLSLNDGAQNSNIEINEKGMVIR
ncbi:MAG: prepilin-type N-terminal cleavage/methylation domain-containing protein [Candidatus Moranbacteria bacterium]|nr:prepilin-type N-terminal cleavage/methylation domain-containing protein [Candidatus Moranbacteria bacterium]